MIIGKLIKPCKICIFYSDDDGGEIESFSLLKLSEKELFNLLGKVENKNDNFEVTLDNSIVLKYSGNDSLHQAWKTIAVEHSKENVSDFLDVSAKFKTEITGTSCLVRDPKNHIIRIALRNGDDNITINRICIDNQIRERFFNDVKQCKRFKESKKYCMDSSDLDIYTYWSKFMNTSYINQFKMNKNKN